jgi:hypothetical protein
MPVSTVFSFPDPVDETSARLVAGGVVALTATTLLAREPRLMAPLTYGFAARVASGPSLSPLGQLATRVVRPRLPVEARPVPGPPKRFAQAMGLTMSGAALALHASGRPGAARGVLGVLLAAASLEAFAGVCLGCKVFAGLMRAGLVPEEVCERCNDIWGAGGLASADRVIAG